MGVPGVKVDTSEGLAKAIDVGLQTGGPNLIQVVL
jgi:thiamine pyrophosphate-dependent acetolactate synthase large subunit-like protein